jgi:hypothetical protein
MEAAKPPPTAANPHVMNGAAGRRSHRTPSKEKNMTLGTLLLIIVVLLLIGAIPAWPYSRSWGYAPSGLVGVVLVVVLVLLLAGQI